MDNNNEENGARLSIRTWLMLMGTICIVGIVAVAIGLAIPTMRMYAPALAVSIMLTLIIGIPGAAIGTVFWLRSAAQNKSILTRKFSANANNVYPAYLDLKAGHFIQAVNGELPRVVPAHYAPHIDVKEVSPASQQQAQAQLPAPALPTAPSFASLMSQIQPGHLFLAQGQQEPRWGDITDLLSTIDIGRPGTGKSTLLRMICGSVLLIGGIPTILDPHGSILDDLGSTLACAETAQEMDESALIFDAKLTRRLQERRAGNKQFRPELFIIDEMPLISMMCPQVLPIIQRVVTEGRKVGMYALIAGVGVPATIFGKDTGTLIRDAMASRYVFCTTPQQARIAGIENETAKSMMAILEDAGPGKAILATAKHKPEIVAIPNTTVDDLRLILSNCSVLDRIEYRTGEKPIEPTSNEYRTTGDFASQNGQTEYPVVDENTGQPLVKPPVVDSGEYRFSVHERQTVVHLYKAHKSIAKVLRQMQKSSRYHADAARIIQEERL